MFHTMPASILIDCSPDLSFNDPPWSVSGFLSGVGVHITISKVEHTVTTSRWSPYLYTINVSHGIFSWSVQRRYHHFFRLNTALFVSRNKPHFGHHKRSRDDYADRVRFFSRMSYLLSS